MEITHKDNKFSWIPIYHEVAERLLGYESRQSDLISFLEGLRSQGLVITKLTDQDSQGNKFLLQEIDPFTFMGVFNRGIKDEQRLAILKEMAKFFDLKNPLPIDFSGLPILNNQNSWFFAYQSKRSPEDCKRLWNVFKIAMADNPLADVEFAKAFDAALKVKYTNLNLTMGLFWIRPDTFLNLDLTNRQYLKLKLPSSGLSAKYYLETIKTIRSTYSSFPELSLQAWQAGNGQPVVSHLIAPANNYWMLVANWSSSDPADQTQRFIEEGVWENEYADRYIDDVCKIQVGDKVAIKTNSTQKHGLPFNAHGKTVSRMTINAVGTVVANRMDGRTIEVEWDRNFKPKHWYFYTYFKKPVWPLRQDTSYAQKLIEFTFKNMEQDFDWFIKQWFDNEQGTSNAASEPVGDVKVNAYSIDDFLASGVFLEEAEVRQAVDRLQSKKNIILQGPPGVGKTFIARKLAYALMEEIDDNRIEFVQFHQSYSYEDFVQGYRPLPEKAGSFGLRNGIFYDFCKRAQEEPERKYVFIIDEINRGNLSQIFGELLVLIEGDKRGAEYGVPLVYSKKDDPRFFLPKELYIIGLMNVADRSLAMVDYALRRRFAFMTLCPQFGSPLLRKWLLDRDMENDLVDLIVARMSALNEEICRDNTLGDNFQVGHSYFCPKGINFKGLNRKWYEGIVRTEIIPLLQEYWFDNPDRSKQLAAKLLA